MSVGRQGKIIFYFVKWKRSFLVVSPRGRETLEHYGSGNVRWCGYRHMGGQNELKQRVSGRGGREITACVALLKKNLPTRTAAAADDRVTA